MSFLHLCWGLLLELKYFNDGEENLLESICIDDDGIVNNDDLYYEDHFLVFGFSAIVMAILLFNYSLM